MRIVRAVVKPNAYLARASAHGASRSQQSVRIAPNSFQLTPSLFVPNSMRVLSKLPFALAHVRVKITPKLTCLSYVVQYEYSPM